MSLRPSIKGSLGTEKNYLLEKLLRVWRVLYKMQELFMFKVGHLFIETFLNI